MVYCLGAGPKPGVGIGGQDPGQAVGHVDQARMDAKGLAVVVDGLPGVALVRQRVGQVGVPLLVLRVQADGPREVGNGLLDSALSQQHGAQGVVGGEGVGVQAQRFLQEAMGRWARLLRA